MPDSYPFFGLIRIRRTTSAPLEPDGILHSTRYGVSSHTMSREA